MRDEERLDYKIDCKDYKWNHRWNWDKIKEIFEMDKKILVTSLPRKVQTK